MRISPIAHEMTLVSIYAFGEPGRDRLMEDDYYTAHRITALLRKAQAVLKKARRRATLKTGSFEIEAYYIRESHRRGIHYHFTNANWRPILLEIASKFRFYGVYWRTSRMQIWEIVTLERWCLLLKSCYVDTKIRSYKV